MKYGLNTEEIGSQLRAERKALKIYKNNHSQQSDMAFDLLALLLLPGLLVFGLATSYEDIRSGRIRNSWVAGALVYSAGMLLIAMAILASRGDPINQEYLIKYGSNIIFALFAGIVIWLCNLWSAGDAKLFLAYAALVPLSFYAITPSDYFPSFILLGYTFVPFLLFYLWKIFFGTKAAIKREMLKEITRPERLQDNLWFVFAFSLLGKGITSFFHSHLPLFNSFFVTLALLFGAMVLFERVLKISAKRVSMTIAIGGMLLAYEHILTIEFMMFFGLMAFLFLFIRYFVLHLAFEVFSSPIYIEDLKPGMMVAENFVPEDDGYRKERLVPLSFLSALMRQSEGKFLFSVASEGLTAEQAETIRRLHSEGKIPEHTIRIFQTVPFAPFLFLGSLLLIGTHLLF